MGIELSVDERRQLAKNAIHGGFSIVELPSAEVQPVSTYHDIKTGKEVYNLPADQWNVSHYKSRGLILGPAPKGAEFILQEETPTPVIAPDNIEEIIKLAVRTALEAVGAVLPETKEGDPNKKIEPKQMKMF